jgi:hypothetical protein
LSLATILRTAALLGGILILLGTAENSMGLCVREFDDLLLPSLIEESYLFKE